MVDIKLLPQPVAELIGFNLAATLPLFVVVIGGIVAGLIIGFVWEWLREMRLRRDGSQKAREVRKLKREVTRLKGEKHEGKDEVLALLEEAS